MNLKNTIYANTLQCLVESTPDLFAALDCHYRVLAFNEAFAREFEEVYGRKVLLGTSLLDLISHLPQERERVRRAWGRALQGEEFVFTEEFGDEKRTRKTFEIRFKSIRDEAGRTEGAFQIVRDVTDAKKVREELDRIELSFHAFFDAAPLMMGIAELVDDDILHVQLNPLAAEFFGLPFDKAKNRPSSEMGTPREIITEWRNHYLKAQKTGAPVQFEYWHTSLYKRQHLSVRVSFIGMGPTGNPRFAYTIEDITHETFLEQKLRLSQEEFEKRLAKENEELRRSEERLKLFIENAPVSIAMFDRDMRYLAVSKRWQLDFKLPDHLIGRSHYEVFPEIAEDWKEVHRKSLAGASLKSDGEEFRRANGTVQWLRWESLPWYLPSGEVGGILISSEEITHERQVELALKQSEARLQSLINHASAAIYYKDLSGRILLGNKMFCEITNQDPKSIVGKTDFDLFPEEFAERFRTNDKRIMSQDKSETIEEVLMFGGELHTFISTKFPLRNDQGKVVALGGISVDISAQKKLEEKLKKSEEDFRVLANNIPQLAWMADETGARFWYNQRWYEFTGITPEEVKGNGWKKVHHPEYLERVTEKYQKSLRIGEAWEDTFPLRSKDGEWRWFLSRAIPIRDTSGKITRWFGTNTDVTEQKRAEAELQKSEAMFRMFIEAMPQIAFIAEPDGRITYLNQRHYDYFHATREESEGLNWQKGRFHHPDDLARTLEVWTRAHDREEPFEIEYRLKCHDGTFRWHLGRGIPIKDSAGKVVYWTGTNTDIQDQKDAEEKIQNLLIAAESARKDLYNFFMNAPVPFVIFVGPEHSFQLANPPFEKLVQQKVMGKSLRDAFPLEEIGHFLSPLDHVYETGIPFVGNELPFRDRLINVGYHPFRSEEGTTKGVFAVFIDVTDSTIARRKVEKLASELQMALSARDDFLSIASHELKTPISSLRLQSQIVKRHRDQGDPTVYSPERVDKLVDQVDRQVGRINRLVDDMLDISRIRSGNLTIQKENFDLCKVIGEVIDRLSSNLQAARTPVTYLCKEGAIEGSWDRMRMEQVVTNLLTNAMRYGNEKPISVVVERTPDDPNRVRISMQDQGIGITPEAKERIFNRFERAVRPSEVSGLGLGLFITRQIVEAHGGRIWVESAGVNQGATFYVELPIRLELASTGLRHENGPGKNESERSVNRK